MRVLHKWPQITGVVYTQVNLRYTTDTRRRWHIGLIYGNELNISVGQIKWNPKCITVSSARQPEATTH
jgi:hypothetical protein